MHRTEGDNYVEVGGKKYYRDESGENPATQLRYQEMNAIQEELAAVIEDTGVALNASTESYAQMNQLLTAIDLKDTMTLTSSLDAIGDAIATEVSNRNTAIDNHVHTGAEGEPSKIDPISHVSNMTEGNVDVIMSSDDIDETEANRTVRLYWRRDQSRVAGQPDIIHLCLNDFVGTSKSAALAATGTPVPSGCRPPSETIEVPCIVINNNMSYMGTLRISTTGSLSFIIGQTNAASISAFVTVDAIEAAYTGFSSTGEKGFRSVCAVYHLPISAPA